MRIYQTSIIIVLLSAIVWVGTCCGLSAQAASMLSPSLHLQVDSFHSSFAQGFPAFTYRDAMLLSWDERLMPPPIFYEDKLEIPEYVYIPLSELPEEMISSIRYLLIGDLHSRYNAFVRLLKKAHYINEAGWNAGDRVLVQTGDIVDRGDSKDAAKIWKLLSQLQSQARKFNGEVVRLLGNHEQLYLRKYFNENVFRAEQFGMYIKVRSDGQIKIETAQFWEKEITDAVAERSVVVAYELLDRLVVHGGVVPGLLQDQNVALDPMGTNASLVEKFNDMLFSRNYSSPIFRIGPGRGGRSAHPGVIWADYYKELVPQSSALRPMIVAHTPTDDGKIAVSPDKRIINIDTGISKYYGGHEDALVVVQKPRVVGQLMHYVGLMQSKRCAPVFSAALSNGAASIERSL